MIHLGIHWVPVYQYVLDQLAPKKIMYHKEVGAGERVCEWVSNKYWARAENEFEEDGVSHYSNSCHVECFDVK